MPAPSASEVGGGVPRTELQELQLKAQEQTDEVSFFFLLLFYNSFRTTEFRTVGSEGIFSKNVILEKCYIETESF